MRVPSCACRSCCALALRNLRGGLGGFGVFLACIAVGVAAIAGVGLGFAVAEGRPRAGGPRHPRRRPLFRSRPARGERGGARLLSRGGASFHRYADARHGAAQGAGASGRRGDGRNQGGRRPLSARRRGRFSIRPASRRCAGRARRRLWRRRRSGLFAAAWTCRRRFLLDRRRAISGQRAFDPRAGPTRRRHRLRAARPDERGGAARDRTACSRAR